MDNRNKTEILQEEEVKKLTFDDYGKCRKCKGTGKLIRGKDRTRCLCQYCGGHGLLDWISDIMNKPQNMKDGLYIMEDGQHVIVKKGKRVV